MAIAGCVGDDSSGEDEADGGTETETEVPEADAEQVFVDMLSDDIAIEGVNHITGTFDVEATTSATDDEGVEAEVQALADAYAALVEDGHGGDEMNVYAYNDDGELEYRVEVEATWASEYTTGEMDADEYYDRALETLNFE